MSRPRYDVVLIALLGIAANVALAADVAAFRVERDVIARPLTGEPGDAARGRALLVAREAANCVLCHGIPDAAIATAGDVGPSLAGIGSRLTPAQIRLRVVDERRVVADSVMPPYYRVDGLHAVAPAWRGKPVLAAGEIEDVVAYLASLK